MHSLTERTRCAACSMVVICKSICCRRRGYDVSCLTSGICCELVQTALFSLSEWKCTLNTVLCGQFAFVRCFELLVRTLEPLQEARWRGHGIALAVRWMNGDFGVTIFDAWLGDRLVLKD